MAKIVSIKKIASSPGCSKNIVDVNCVYETERLPDGESCVVLKTYNPKSQNAGYSQILHITRDAAVRLIEILNKELHL